MSSEEGKFYVDIPNTVTSVGGNYQIYFALKENIQTTINVTGGAIGDPDDPTYQEIFISDVCKGVVDSNSGASLLPSEFDWESGLYDYETGLVSCLSSLWEEVTVNGNTETGIYQTSIYLGGLQDGKTKEDIQPRSPDESLVLVTGKELNGKTLTITATFQQTLTDKEEEALLEKIVIAYPVNFPVANSLDGFALKSDIKVVYDPTSVSVDKNYNTMLGMKMDAYVTPINLSGLYNFPSNTKKYVVFSRNKESLVCEAKDDKCWIPIQVTGLAGSWQLAFIVKGTSTDGNTNYEYHTGIISLPVVDNTISRGDLLTNTAYRAILDTDAKALYDANEYALYAISESDDKVKLQHTATVINQAIGWAAGIYPSVNAEQIVTAVGNFETVSNNYNTLRTNLETANTNITTNLNKIESEITRATSAEENLQTEIDEINATIETLDVTMLKSTVESHGESIEDHSGKIEVLETDMFSAKSSINDYKSFKETYSQAVANLQAADKKHDEEIKEIQTINSNQNGRLVKIEGNINLITENIQAHGGRLDSIESNLNSESKLIAELLATERTERTEADEKLEDAIEDAIEKAQDEAQKLEEKINEEISRATNAEVGLSNRVDVIVENLNAEIERAQQAEKDNADAISKNAEDISTNTANISTNATNISTNAQAISTLSEKHSSDYQELKGDINSINSSIQIVRNDFNGVYEKPYVSRIVLIQHMHISKVASMIGVSYETTEEKNAFNTELINAGIITNTTDLTQPLLAEQVIEILRFKEATETNTLYLVQEEE
jgi:hypothetical protein